MTPKTYPSHVNIVEVGPRDGLQNEAGVIATADKLAFIQKLVEAGHKQIEVTSFVHPQRVPQLADASELIQGLLPQPGVTYSALVPNLKGLDRAITSGVKRVAIFTAASSAFTTHNIGMTVEESLVTFRPVATKALEHGMTVRGYVSTVWVCPYTGNIDKEAVKPVVEALLDMGCDEISLGDTIGAASPKDVWETMTYLLEFFPKEKLALHFHDTYGTALANVMAGLELGITTFDASAGGLGGCPYAPGASGNLATEDLIYLLDRMGIACGVNLQKQAEASLWIQKILGCPLPSKQLKRLTTHD